MTFSETMKLIVKGIPAFLSIAVCSLVVYMLYDLDNNIDNTGLTKSDSVQVKKQDILQAIPLAHSQYVIVSYKDSATHKVVNSVADSAATVAFIKSLHVLSVPMDTLYVIKEVPAGQKKKK